MKFFARVLALVWLWPAASLLAGHGSGGSHGGSHGSSHGTSHGGSHHGGSGGGGSHHGGHPGGSHGSHHHHFHSIGNGIFFGAPFWGGLGWWYPGEVSDVCPECEPAEEGGLAPEGEADERPHTLRGRLVFDVEPDDAAVYLDGHLIGAAAELAETLRGVPAAAGTHAIEILRPGFRSWSKEIDLAPGESRDLEVSLEKNEGP